MIELPIGEPVLPPKPEPRAWASERSRHAAAPPLLLDVLISEAALPWLQAPTGVGPEALPLSAEQNEHNVLLWDPQGDLADSMIQTLALAAGTPLQQLCLRAHHDLQPLAMVTRASITAKSGLLQIDRLLQRQRPDGVTAQASGRTHVLAVRPAQGIAPVGTLTDALSATADLVVAFATTGDDAVASSQWRAQMLACTRRPGWQCRTMIVVLPASANADARRAWSDAHWPADLHLLLLVADVGQAPLALWHGIVALWQQGQSPASPADPVLDAAAPALARLARLDGVEACALVNLADARLIAVERHPMRASALGPEALSDQARALCSARATHAGLSGEHASPDEWLVTTGQRQCLLRRLPGQRPWGFLAVADRSKVNLALLRCCLQDLERVFP